MRLSCSPPSASAAACRRRDSKLYERTLAFSFPLLALIAWQLIVDAGILSPLWFPQPTRIAKALWDVTVNYDRFSETSLIGRPWLIPERLQTQGWAGVWSLFAESHVWATLGRVGVGFVIGAIPGILLGVVMGINRTVRLMLDTTLSAIYVLPKIAIFPIVMLMFADPFGEGPEDRGGGAVGVLPDGDQHHGRRARHRSGVSDGRAQLRRARLLAVSPRHFAGGDAGHLRRAAAGARHRAYRHHLVEFLRAKQGVGFMTFYYWEVLNPEKMYAGLVVVMMLGVVLTYGLQALQRRLMPWQR